MSSNYDEKSICARPQTTPIDSPTPIVSVEPTAPDKTSEWDISVEQEQTDLTGFGIERDTLMSNVNRYKVRVHTMYVDSKQTNITIYSLATRLEELEKENDTLWTENSSITKKNEEPFTKHMACVPTLTGRNKEVHASIVCTSALLWICKGLEENHSYVGGQESEQSGA